MNQKYFSLVGVALILGFMSCNEEPVVQAPAKPAAPKTSSAPLAARQNLFETKKDEYFFNPTGKRDPFKTYVPDVSEGVKVPRSPLERYSLNELALAGIVWGISDPRALMKAPDGYSYIVRANTRVGKNRGRVSKITKKSVYIEEEYRDPAGKVVVMESKFNLREPKVKDDAESENMKLRYSDD